MRGSQLFVPSVLGLGEAETLITADKRLRQLLLSAKRYANGDKKGDDITQKKKTIKFGSSLRVDELTGFDGKEVSNNTTREKEVNMLKKSAILISFVICIMLLSGCQVYDTESPTVSITYPMDGDSLSGVVTITATAEDNEGILRVEFYIDDSLKHTDTDEPYSYQWNTSLLPDSSSHTIMAKAYDKAENVGESDVISVIVIREEMELELVGQLVIPGSRYVTVSGSYAYLSGGPSGGDKLRAIDISNPASPRETWSGMTGLQSAPMLIKDSYLYVLHYNKGRIFDISDPAYPESVGVFDNGDTLFLMGEGDIYDNYLFTGTYTYDKHYFVVWDISNPTSPTPVGSYSTGSGQEFIDDVKVSSDGNYAYLAVDGYGLRVMDVSNPGSPYEVGSFELGDGSEIEIYGSYLFLSANPSGSQGIRIIDISNPASPTLIGSPIPLAGDAYAMALSYPYLYRCHAWYLYVNDVSDPLSASEIAVYDGGDTGLDITLSGGYIYVAWLNQGFVILRLR